MQVLAPLKMEEILKALPVFGSWSSKCAQCANYSGSQQSCGFCRVWGAVVLPDAAITRQCPHWTSRDAARMSAAG
jgi:hypothetical protein